MAGSRVRDCVNAAVDALKVHAGLLAIVGSGKVATHIPQGTDPPWVMVRGGDEVPWVVTLEEDDDGGDNGARQVNVEVQCVSTYKGSSQVDEMASLVMASLTDEDTWAAVTGFQLAEFVRNAASPPADLNNDGVLWFVRFVTIRVSLV